MCWVGVGGNVTYGAMSGWTMKAVLNWLGGAWSWIVKGWYSCLSLLNCFSLLLVCVGGKFLEC